MKVFTILLIALIAINYTHAITEELKKSYYDECLEQVQSYRDCFVQVEGNSESQIKKKCSVYHSERCQNFYKNPYKMADKCELAKEYYTIDKLSPSELKLQVIINNLVCETTKEGDLCPIVQTYVKDYPLKEEVNYILDNCRYTNCNNVYIKALELDLEYAEEGDGNIEYVEYVMNLAKSEECKSKAIKPVTTTTSTTTSTTTTVTKTITKTTTTTTTTTTIPDSKSTTIVEDEDAADKTLEIESEYATIAMPTKAVDASEAAVTLVALKKPSPVDEQFINEEPTSVKESSPVIEKLIVDDKKLSNAKLTDDESERKIKLNIQSNAAYIKNADSPKKKRKCIIRKKELN